MNNFYKADRSLIEDGEVFIPHKGDVKPLGSSSDAVKIQNPGETSSESDPAEDEKSETLPSSVIEISRFETDKGFA